TGAQRVKSTFKISRAGTFYFGGSLDELIVYDRDINSDEVATLYNSGAAWAIPDADYYSLPMDLEDIRPEKELVQR
ncbi:hypothetical protein LCGC14_3113130, partial [marine sediment metagenome]